MNPEATVVITTKNRKEDLARAIRSCQKQTAFLEILVIDDGSTDGTSLMVREMFPDVRLYQDEISKGYIAQRNRGITLATCEIIFSIDDDAEFSSPFIASEIIDEFSEPEIAAVAIPFINVNFDGAIHQKSPGDGQVWVTNEFIGTAHALRRSTFLKVGGYRETLFHQGEEGDLCIRLLDQRYYICLGHSDPIYHYESPNRSQARINTFGQRNLILFAWHNVPNPEIFVHLPATILKGLAWGIQKRWFFFRLRGTIHGMFAVLKEIGNRKPVSRRTYLLYRKLKKTGPQPLASLQNRT